MQQFIPTFWSVHSVKHWLAASHQLHDDNVIHIPLVTLNAVLQKVHQIAFVVWIAVPVNVDDQSPWNAQDSNRVLHRSIPHYATSVAKVVVGSMNGA